MQGELLKAIVRRMISMICPRCGSNMKYRIESESYGDGNRNVSMYFKCELCGYRVQDKYIRIVNSSSKSIIVKVSFR